MATGEAMPTRTGPPATGPDTGADTPRPLDVADGMRRRRMYREFEERPVPRELLERMVWAATRAQQARSGVRNLVVVDDPRLMATARQVLPGFLNNAPAMLVHCTDLERAERVMGRRGARLASRLDAGAACAHLALMAQTLGLGICTITSWSGAAVSALLDLPPHIRPDVTIAVGYVPATPAPGARGFTTSVHHNRFGSEFPRGDR
ncbi:nitroreductase family protein [Streptomyces sp. NPDC004609]|uniref:nitroreductase family protein n=1 Tax=Streptomyces sp. NPDC004609 TaxID=3364704 RepID=UPI00369A7271